MTIFCTSIIPAFCATERFSKYQPIFHQKSGDKSKILGLFIGENFSGTLKVYAEDMEEIRQKQEEIWQQLRYLESQLQLVRQ